MSEVNDFLSTPDKNLGKNIQFQIYYKGEWYDSLTDEILSYIFPYTEKGKANPSTIVIKRVNGKIYTWNKMTEGTPETTDGLRKMGIPPATTTAGELYEIVYTEENLGTVYFYKCTSIGKNYTVLTSTAEIKPEDEIEVTLTPNQNLKTQYPYSIVTVDGNEYTLAFLSNPFTFNMNRDHRMTISWLPGELVETFRIIATR